MLQVSTLATAGRRLSTKFCDFVASQVESVQKQSTGEKRQPITQQEGLEIKKEVLTKHSQATCASKVTFAPEIEGGDL